MKRAALALILLLGLTGAAGAQATLGNLPAGTVVGRGSTGPGPAQAIPFASLGPLLSIASTTSVNGVPFPPSYTVGNPLIGNGTATIQQGTRSGNTTVFGTANGTLTNGHCVSIDGSGNFVDAGGACTTGGGGGTVSSASQYNISYYATTGTTVSGLANGTAGLPLIEGSPPSWGQIGTAGISNGAVTTTQIASATIVGGNIAAATVANSNLANMAADTVKCNLTSGAAAPTDCTGIILKGANLTNQVGGATNKWFTDDAPQVTLLNLNDRVFIGGATSNNGASTGSLTGDWFSTFQSGISGGPSPGFIFNAQTVSITNATNNSAGTGVLAAAQSLNFTTGRSAIGITSVAVNNNTTQNTIGYGIYSECHLKSTAHFVACFASEADPRTEQATTQPDPFTNAVIVGYQSACGAGDTSTGHPCGAAYQVVANPETYNVGINFESGSVTSGGAGGNTAAISLPTGYQLIWYSAAGTIVGSMGFDGSGNLVIVASGCVKINGTCVTVP